MQTAKKGVQLAAYNGKGARRSKLKDRASEGVKTTDDIWEISGVTIEDLASGRIPASDVNAVCKAMGVMLKVIDVEHRAAKTGVVGRVIALGGRRVLQSKK